MRLELDIDDNELRRLYRTARRFAARWQKADIDDLTQQAFKRFLDELPRLLEKKRSALQAELKRSSGLEVPEANGRAQELQRKVMMTASELAADCEVQNFLERCLYQRVRYEARGRRAGSPPPSLASVDPSELADEGAHQEPLFAWQEACVVEVLASPDGRLLAQWRDGETLDAMAMSEGQTIAKVWRRIQSAAEELRRCIAGSRKVR